MTESRRRPLQSAVCAHRSTLALVWLFVFTRAWQVHSLSHGHQRLRSPMTQFSSTDNHEVVPTSGITTRRDALADSATKTFMVTMGFFGVPAWHPPGIARAADTDSSTKVATSFTDLLTQVQQAREQLDKVPPFIEQEKWDSVRAVLLEKPLADCWAKTNRPLLSNYAEALGDAGGDELAALEAKEELVSHLRYLDMAVYNNNFNPITVEGKSGATKELIRSYYEDPINEFKASKQALEELITLSKDL